MGIRRNFKIANITALSVFCLILMLIGITPTLSGCSACKENNMHSNTKTLPDGKLTRVEYSTGNGTIARAEFSITITPDEVVDALFWPEEAVEIDGKTYYQPTVSDEIVSLSHAPISEGRWEEVEAIIAELAPLLEIKPESKVDLPDAGEFPGMQILDGGDWQTLRLGVQTADGEHFSEYYVPSDRQMITLTTLLREIVDPIGRDIPHYATPVLVGLYFSQSSSSPAKDFSFQCGTPSVDADAEERLFIYRFTEKTGLFSHDSQSATTTISYQDWAELSSLVDELCLKDYPRGTSKDKATCSLYYSDSAQLTVKLDKKAVESLYAALKELAVNHAG